MEGPTVLVLTELNGYISSINLNLPTYLPTYLIGVGAGPAGPVLAGAPEH